jgi:hypothetical protein
MKKLILVFFTTLCSLGFAQQNQITRTHYNYTISQVENEQLLQQVVNEITAYEGIADCKYTIVDKSKNYEITFTFNERQQKGEHDKTNSLPNVKKMLLDKGLEYNHFTFKTESLTK